MKAKFKKGQRLYTMGDDINTGLRITTCKFVRYCKPSEITSYTAKFGPDKGKKFVQDCIVDLGGGLLFQGESATLHATAAGLRPEIEQWWEEQCSRKKDYRGYTKEMIASCEQRLLNTYKKLLRQSR